MMKKFIAPIAIVLLIVGTAYACRLTTSNGLTPENKEFSITPFTSLSIAGPFNVEFTQGATTSARVEAGADDMENVVMEVKNNELVIKPKKSKNMQEVTIYLSTPELTKVGIAGSGNFKATSNISSEKPMHFSIAGSGNIVAAVTTGTVKSEIAGSGNIQLRGAAANSSIQISGSGNYKGAELKSENVKVEIAGSGDARVNATVNLDAEIAGSGNVEYSGNPANVKKDVSGSGSVKQGN